MITSLLVKLFSRFLQRGAKNVPEENPLIKLAVFSGVLSNQHGLDQSPLSNLYPTLAVEYGAGFQGTSSSSSLLPESTERGSFLDWDGLLFAVPKKRTSHSKKRLRMTHKYLKPRHNYTVCPKCNNLKLIHVLCGHCLKEVMKETAAMRRAQIEEREGGQETTAG